jgi:hypothetical protein
VILYYAMGGGLGHLTRARAVLHTLRIRQPVALLTASPYAQNRAVTAGMHVIPVPPELEDDPVAYRVWLHQRFEHIQPEAIYLDAFPAGIQGELDPALLPAGVPIFHLARRLRWARYSDCMQSALPRMATSYVLEPLEAAHRAWLRNHSDLLLNLSLCDPPPAGLSLDVRELRKPGRPLWLICHAGADREIAELLDYAALQARYQRRQPQVLLVAPQRPDWLPAEVAHLDCYPVYPLFALVDAIFSAGGFNSMRQTAAFADKHYPLPFPRRFDDQFARVAQRRGKA